MINKCAKGREYIEHCEWWMLEFYWNLWIIWPLIPSIYPKPHKTCCLCKYVWLNLSGHHFCFSQWKMKSVSQICKGLLRVCVCVFFLRLSQTDKLEVTAWAAAGDNTSRSRCKVTGVRSDSVTLWVCVCVCFEVCGCVLICDRDGKNKK